LAPPDIQESGIVLSTLAEAPIVHLKLAEPSGDRFEDEKTLQAIVDEALEQGMRCSPSPIFTRPRTKH
jgi:hypothetical protein